MSGQPRTTPEGFGYGYESAGAWTWNTLSTDDTVIELNLHELKRKVVLSARDIERMQVGIATIRAVRGG